MKHIARGTIVLLVVLLLAWGLVAWFDWLPRPGPAQRAVVAFMEAGERPAGQDALPLVYLLNHEVPADAWPDLLALPTAELATRVQEWPRRQVPVLIERQRVPSLAQAADHAEALRASVAEAAGLRAQLPALERAVRIDEPRLGAPGNPLNALPPPDLMAPARALRQAAALAYLEGDAVGAAAALCASAATWRRLLGTSNGLLVTLGLARNLELDARLLAELRGRSDAAAAMPCAALAPPRPAEDDLCPALRGELQQLLAFSDAQLAEASWWDRAQARLVWHREHTRALDAQALAAHCQTPPAEAVALLEQPVQCSRLAWLFNMGGCAISAIRAPTYHAYAERLADHMAVLRLAALADWLRAGDRDSDGDGGDGHRDGDGDGAQDLAERLAARPAALRTADQRLRVEDGEAWLEFSANAPGYGSRGAPVAVRLHALP